MNHKQKQIAEQFWKDYFYMTTDTPDKDTFIAFCENLADESRLLDAPVMPMLAEVLAEVDKEPELSGEIPDEIKGILLLAGFDEKHFDAIKFMLRTTVKLTKQGITKRIEELYASKHSA